MNETESEQTQPPLARGILYNYYRPVDDQSHPLSKLLQAEALSWQVYAQQAPGHAVPLVMLHASQQTWDLGYDAVRKDVVTLVKTHAAQFGWPSVSSTCPDRAARCGPQAAWALRIGNHFCRFIVIDNDKKELTPGRIAYLPVFPMRRGIDRHSLEALHLIFPQVAATAIETMDKNTMPN